MFANALPRRRLSPQEAREVPRVDRERDPAFPHARSADLSATAGSEPAAYGEGRWGGAPTIGLGGSNRDGGSLEGNDTLLIDQRPSPV